MGDIITTEELKNPFSEFPKEMDEYFHNKEIIIMVFPSTFVDDVKEECLNFKVSSANQYYKYLTSERTFWTENDKKAKLNQITNAGSLSSAISSFDNALKCYQDDNITQGQQYLNSSMDYIKNGVLYSKTNLAQYLINYSDKEDNFRRGLKFGLTKNSNSNTPTTLPDLEGLMTALTFRGIKCDAENTICDEVVATLDNNVIEANNRYAKLNEEYTRSFHELQEMLTDIHNKTNKHLKDMETKSQQYFDENDKRCNELEMLYNEKLMLEVPAKYWENTENHYNQQGKKWLTASCWIAGGTIIVLALILILIPNLFSKDAHWMDVLKNSAIITVITSIAVYVLRTAVKMTMSSFHLARDAKERNMLTYFYLSLIKERAVTEKERALVINSLFSRADTGLLKNDSTPAMSNNVSELVQVMTKGN